MTPIIVILIIFVAAPMLFKALAPMLGRLLQKLLVWYSRRKSEEFMSRAMGIDPKEARKARKEAEREQRRQRKKSASGSGFDGAYYNSRTRKSASGEHIIPPEYAEDVEYTEVKEFSSTEIEGEGKRRRNTFKREEQISDAEWEDIS